MPVKALFRHRNAPTQCDPPISDMMVDRALIAMGGIPGGVFGGVFATIFSGLGNAVGGALLGAAITTCCVRVMLMLRKSNPHSAQSTDMT